MAPDPLQLYRCLEQTFRCGRAGRYQAPRRTLSINGSIHTIGENNRLCERLVGINGEVLANGVDCNRNAVNKPGDN